MSPFSKSNQKNVYFKYELNIKCRTSRGFVIWGR